MATFRLPLSGNVTQSFFPWAWNFIGAQYGLINVELGTSENPEAEKATLDNVGSYGKQLGRIGEVPLVLLDHLEREDASLKNNKAIIALRQPLNSVQNVKNKHARPTS